MGLACCAEKRIKEEKEGVETAEVAKSEKRQTDDVVTSTAKNLVNIHIFGDELLDRESDDEEIEIQHKNKFEHTLKMTKTELIAFWDRERSDSNGKWEVKLNEAKIKVSVKSKGSELTKDFPSLMCDMYFDAGTSINNMMRAVHNNEERMKWDKDIEFGEILSIVNSKLMLWHQRNKSPIQFVNKRDFLEKKFKLTKGNRHFIFFTSIPDHIQKPEPHNTRAQTVIGIHCFETLEDGRILFSGIMQTDFNLGTGRIARFAQAGTLNQLPKSLKKWFHLLEQHLVRMAEEGQSPEAAKSAQI